MTFSCSFNQCYEVLWIHNIDAICTAGSRHKQQHSLRRKLSTYRENEGLQEVMIELRSEYLLSQNDLKVSSKWKP